jgi:hypothetical protein
MAVIGAFLFHFNLSRYDMILISSCADHVVDTFTGAVATATHRFSVNGNDFMLTQFSDRTCSPGKTAFQLSRIQGREDTVKSVMGRSATG